MNPYQTSRQTSSSTTKPSPGAPCLECQSPNVGKDDQLRPRPGILAVILFGWLAILIRTAFASKTEACRDCGATRSYRTTGNYVAMFFLGILILLIALAWAGI